MTILNPALFAPATVTPRCCSLRELRAVCQDLFSKPGKHFVLTGFFLIYRSGSDSKESSAHQLALAIVT